MIQSKSNGLVAIVHGYGAIENHVVLQLDGEFVHHDNVVRRTIDKAALVADQIGAVGDYVALFKVMPGLQLNGGIVHLDDAVSAP